MYVEVLLCYIRQIKLSYSYGGGRPNLLLFGALTWLFQSCEDGLSAGVLGIRELHDTIVVCLIQTKHSAGLLRFWEGKGRREGKADQNTLQ